MSALKLHLDNQLCFLFYAISRRITRVYKPLLKETGLTYPQYLVMMVLWERADRATAVGDICRLLHLDTGTVTPLLKRMQAQGLVLRKRDMHDERVVVVSLTTQGRQLQKKCLDIPHKMACKVGGDLAQLTQVRSLLVDLLQRLPT